MTAPKNNIVENKPKASTIPIDLIMLFLCPAYEEGFVKYWRESWRKGFNTTTMADSLLHHYSAYIHDKEDYDKESWEKYKIKKHHLGAMLFCVLCMCDTFENHPELDDRHKDWEKEKKEKTVNPRIKEHQNSMIAVVKAFTEFGTSIQNLKRRMELKNIMKGYVFSKSETKIRKFKNKKQYKRRKN